MGRTSAGVDFTHRDGMPWVVFTGDVDMEIAQAVDDESIESARTDGDAVIDLSDTTFLDSQALGLMVSIRKVIGGTVRLVGVSPNVRKLLRVTALDQVFAIDEAAPGA